MVSQYFRPCSCIAAQGARHGVYAAALLLLLSGTATFGSATTLPATEDIDRVTTITISPSAIVEAGTTDQHEA